MTVRDLGEMADELSDLAGFRNMLVHVYWRLDIDTVYNTLQEALSTLKELILAQQKDF